MAESTRRRNRQGDSPDAPTARRARSGATPAGDDSFRRGFASLTQLALSGVQITACVIDVKSGRLLFSSTTTSPFLPPPSARFFCSSRSPPG